MLQFYLLLKRCLIVAVGIITLSSTINSQIDTKRMVSISLDNNFTMVKTDKQKNLLQKIKGRETTASVKIFKVKDINEMANSTSLRFDDKIIYSINSVEIKQLKRNNLWQGKPNEAEANMTTLIFSEDDVTGSVWVNGRLYKIEPLGDGIHAFIENDQSKSLNCPQPIEIKEDDNGSESLNKGEAIQTDPPVIEVLVAYTTTAKNASGNINSLIQLALAEANQSYQNSDVTVRMNLVYTYEVSYTETGNTLTDLNRFTNTSDGYMDNVHTLRNTYGADVCVLIISNTTDSTVGRAWLNSSVSSAFSVVRYDYATGYYTFAHEIGHNQNCRHDPCVDSLGTYNHGYRYCNGSWRTIMAPYSQSCCNSNRIQYWSNPNKTYNGVAMGTTQYEDCARMLGEKSPTIAGFKTSFTSDTLATNQTWYYKSLSGNVTVPSGVTLTIGSGGTINLNGYYIKSTGGTITVEGGATINGYTARITQSGQIKGYYSTFAQALSNATSGQTIELYNTVNLSSVASIGSGITLLVKSGTTINFGSYYIISGGGTITVESGVTNFVCLKNGGTIKGLFPTVNSALNLASSGETIEVIGTSALTSSFELPSSYTILLKQNATLNMNSYDIVLTGGTVNFESGSSLGSLKAYLKYSSTLKGYYGTISSAIADAGTNYTVELLTKSYSESISFSSRSNINLLGQGINSTLINGTISITNSSNIFVTRLRTNGVTINSSSNCGFDTLLIQSASIMSDYGGTATYFGACQGTYGGASFAYNSYGGTGDIDTCIIEGYDVGVYLTNSASYNVATENEFCNNEYDIYSPSPSFAYAVTNQYSRSLPGAVYGNVQTTGQNSICGEGGAPFQYASLNKGTTGNPTEIVDVYLQLLRTIRRDKQNNINNKSYYTQVVDDLINQSIAGLNSQADKNTVKKHLQMLNHLYKTVDGMTGFNNLLFSLLDNKRLVEYTPYIKRYFIWDEINGRNYEGALKLANEIYSSQKSDEDLSCEMLYEKGLIYKYYLNDSNTANDTFLELINNYPGHTLNRFAAVEMGIQTPELSKPEPGKETPIKSKYSLNSYPNPFNPTTTITYNLLNQSKVLLKIYDILGREVAELVNETKEVGSYSIQFNARNLASGLYILTMKVNDLENGQTFTKSQKLLLTK